MAPLGVVVIGVGRMGRRHAENVRRVPELRLVGVVDTRLEIAQQVAEALGAPRWGSDAADAVAHPDCQAVIIATAGATHTELVELAARYRRDILCEKPLAPVLADAQRAVAAVERAGCRLQVGFMRRYDPGYAAARAAIAGGQIGRPLIFKAVSRDREPGPIDGIGGIFVDSAIHDFDLARWLMDDEVRDVTAVAVSSIGRDAAPASPDTGLITLRFAGGAVGAAEVFARAGYGYDIRTEVVGSAGTVRIGRDADRPLAVLSPEGARTDFVGDYLARFATAYELELRDWARRMLADEPPAVTGHDGVRALQIALAAKDAARHGRTVPVAG